MMLPARKQCRRCRRVKPLDQFAHHARTADRRQAWCRTCNRITRTLYRRQRGSRERRVAD